MTEDRERRLIDAFVEVTGSLVADYDVVEMLQTLVDNATDLFDVDAAGIMLANQDSELEVIVATSERSNLLGILQLEAGEGPCIEAFRTGTTVSADDPEDMGRRWPVFATESGTAGYASVHSIPLRARAAVLGSLNLFRNTPGHLNDRDAAAARALTDVATIIILQQQSAGHAARAQEQLQQALDSRIAIEQAKGFLAHTHQVDMDTAFALLRRYARSHQMLLQEAARGVTERTIVIPPAQVPDPAPSAT
ncbi:GAF and ANTAR domain-containing protein [Curtobacterium pusillum]|uniref:GAF and ANTAR domain-containing protein n=1 Tax=Curtobacterium pusillum TaxID=69373 RepID=UPI00119DEFCD|nr:GAF and ANTAR domain-containing protein [Curtobacterium pusillum]